MPNYKIISILLSLYLLLPFTSLAQEEDEDEYNSQLVYGINFNTNGGIIGGAMVKYATSIGPNMFQTFGVEVVNVKHPKEIRQQYPNGAGAVIFGKSNYLFSVRPQYGRELVLFRKAPEEGVEIHAIGAIGPTFGLVKPYYILYDYGINDIRSEAYNPEKHNNISRILSSGGVFEGIGETKINLGFNVKAGFSFELSGFRSSVTGFEVGYLFEAFPKKVILMPISENKQLFNSLYLNIYFGSKQ